MGKLQDKVAIITGGAGVPGWTEHHCRRRLHTALIPEAAAALEPRSVITIFRQGTMKIAYARTSTARVSATILVGSVIMFHAARGEAAGAPQRVDGDDYPVRPIRMIDGYPAGGASDVMARLIGQKLTERFGQTVIVENRPGAAGNPAAEIVAKASPDGYTMLLGVVSALASSVSLYPRLGYDVMKDLAPITLVASSTYVVVVNPAVPAKSLSELVALAKARPGQVGYGSSGVGGGAHLAGELFKNRAGINVLHVPYKGGPPILAAVAAGEVQFGYAGPTAAVAMIKAGRVNGHAVTSVKRAKTLPDVPTIAESGFPGYDITPWYGLLVPAATPAGIVKLLHTEISKIMQSPEIQTRFEGLGFEATASTPERFREVMRTEIQLAAKIIKDAGIKPD